MDTVRRIIALMFKEFIMILKDQEFGENGMLVFADCAVHPNPTASELAEIAVATAKTTKNIAGFDINSPVLNISSPGFTGPFNTIIISISELVPASPRALEP